MERIIFIDNLDQEGVKEKIEDILDETRATYQININNKCIVVQGNNDILRAVIISLNNHKFITY